MTQNLPLKIYNSLTRKKEVFKPQNPDRVTMYNCGPTVYSYAHIGNARAAVVADILFRLLREIYGESSVVYARNITDVDDKIIKRAKEDNVEIHEITEKFADIYNKDLAAIGCLRPTEQPKCTEYIDSMVKMISLLISKKFAYMSDNHVFFDVSRFEDYGNLSGNNLEDLITGARLEEGETSRKRNNADFVLWKPELDGVGWNSPFGKGRPGWHIECSAMAQDVLNSEGYTIDIHCGGIDLKFPHHENEIAQSVCAHDGAPLANYWVHNEFLNMGDEKMSKSTGNVQLINDLLDDWDGEVIRLSLIKAHYKSELVWTKQLLQESKQNLDRWYRVLKRLSSIDFQFQKETRETLSLAPDFDKIINCLKSDLNTVGAISELESLFDNLNVLLNEADKYDNGDFPISLIKKVSEVKNALEGVSSLLGILVSDPLKWFKRKVSDDDESLFDALAHRREMARKLKDWKSADEARDEARAHGVILEDNASGTTWRMV